MPEITEGDDIFEMIEDSLTELIADSIDMDWTSRVGAKAIVEKLRNSGLSGAALLDLDEALE